MLHLWQLMLVDWRPLVLYQLLFGLLGLAVGLVLHTDKKKAEFIIAAEEQGASGMDGLLAQFGLDIGSSNPGGVFEGESLVRRFQLRSVVERSLVTEVEYVGQAGVVAEIRALLLAALRSAGLWRQSGGSLWAFVVRRRAMAGARDARVG